MELVSAESGQRTLPRHSRVVLYGGTDLGGEVAEFVGVLAEVLLAGDGISLVTGGFGQDDDHKDARSVDQSAVDGARRALASRGERLEDFVETWLPEPEMDRRGVVRFRAGQVKILRGRSAQARRLSLVQDADAVVTFKGVKNTAMVLDMALATGRPALPLPFTGGDSEKYWKDNRAQIQQWFHIDDAFADELEGVRLAALGTEGQRGLAERIRYSVLAGIRRECLVLMAYDPSPEEVYRTVVEPTIRQHRFVPVRVDRSPEGGPIYDSFVRSLASCACVVADITDLNANVMYELGHVHAHGLWPFLFARVGTPAELVLPFYLLPHRVGLIEDLGAFLDSARTVVAGHVSATT